MYAIRTYGVFIIHTSIVDHQIEVGSEVVALVVFVVFPKSELGSTVVVAVVGELDGQLADHPMLETG